MAERSQRVSGLALRLCLATLIVQISLNKVSALRVPSQGVITSRLPTSTLLQASPAEEHVGNVYNGYNLDTSALQDSLKEMRESMDSIQDSIAATKNTLASASISSASMAISDASTPSSSSHAIMEVSTASAALSSSSPVDVVQMEDAPQIWNDVMAQLQRNSPQFFQSPTNDDQYFPSSSVDSMRDSLSSIHQSIQAGHAIHGIPTTSTNMLLANLPTDHATVVDAAITTTVGATNHVPTLMDYLTDTIGGSANGNIQSKLSSIVSSDNPAWKDASKFLENASSDSMTMWSDAKIKLSMMVSNTYLMFGLEPPEAYAKSGVTITPHVSLFTAFFALLWAMGSKQMARSQAEESMKTIILEYQRQQATLKSQMLPMKIEISRLNGEVVELKEELVMTNAQIERLEFKRSLERQFWATKLKAKRRRVHRMRQALVTKKAQLETGTWQHEERMETVRQHNKVLEELNKNGKIVFDQSVKVVSFLGDQLAAQHQLHQARMEDQRLQAALREVEEMDQVHQVQMEDQRLQDALKEVEDLDLEQLTKANGSSMTNSTTIASTQVPLYFATSQMIQP